MRQLSNPAARTEASWIASALALVLAVLAVAGVALPERFLAAHETLLNRGALGLFTAAAGLASFAFVTAVTGEKGKRLWPALCSCGALLVLVWFTAGAGD